MKSPILVVCIHEYTWGHFFFNVGEEGEILVGSKAKRIMYVSRKMENSSHLFLVRFPDSVERKD